MADNTGLTHRPWKVAEAAKIAGMTEATIYQAVADGTVPSLRIGRRIFIPRAKFIAWLEGEA